MENPRTGVVNLHINLVSDCWEIFWILIPLVFSSAKISTDSDGRPFGSWIILTSVIEFPVRFASIIPLSIFCFEDVLTTTSFGGVM